MAIVIIVFIIVCGIIWYKTRAYRTLNGSKSDLARAKVLKEVRKVKSKINKVEENDDA